MNNKRALSKVMSELGKRKSPRKLAAARINAAKGRAAWQRKLARFTPAQRAAFGRKCHPTAKPAIGQITD